VRTLLCGASVVNYAIDEWRRRLSACVDAEGGHFEDYLGL